MPQAAAAPDDLLDAALAASAVLRIVRFVRRARLKVRQVGAEASHVRLRTRTMFTLFIQVEGLLTEPQRLALQRAAAASSVHRLLIGQVVIETLDRLDSE